MFHAVPVYISRTFKRSVLSILTRYFVATHNPSQKIVQGFPEGYCTNTRHLTLLHFGKSLPYLRRMISNEALNCWKCGQQMVSRALFCEQCDALQRPDQKLDYFKIMGIEATYVVEASELTRNYRRLQNVLHPDRFSNRHEEEIKISEEYSSLVNKAYFTLLQPLSRGLYMLELNGIFIDEATKQSSSEFLMEIMEENERVDEAQDADKLRELALKNRTILVTLETEVAKAFTLGNLKEAEAAVIRMKYYASIASKIKDMKQRKGFED